MTCVFTVGWLRDAVLQSLGECQCYLVGNMGALTKMAITELSRTLTLLKSYSVMLGQKTKCSKLTPGRLGVSQGFQK